MNCHNHLDRPAIGLCPACHKGNCPECGTHSEIFSCDKPACIAMANNIDHIVKNSIKRTNTMIKKSYITEIILALFFIAIGYQFYPKEIYFSLTFFGFGLILLGYAIYALIKKDYRLEIK